MTETASEYYKACKLIKIIEGVKLGENIRKIGKLKLVKMDYEVREIIIRQHKAGRHRDAKILGDRLADVHQRAANKEGKAPLWTESELAEGIALDELNEFFKI